MTGGVVIVPHTHWDREWYEPFQRFRLRLVDVVDDVIVRARQDPAFRFTFDGQTAAVEDYLEVRPERRQDMAELSSRGQFAIGPWRVLLDEFCCSGENIIRNLQIGHRQAAALGPVMRVGYLPDMFGHIAQMPQILRGAGFEHACVWRGVPADVDTHAFGWIAPDGSWVRTEYLIAGYGNVSDLDDETDDLGARFQRRVRRLAGAFGGDDVLAMYGTDHSGPLPTFMSMVGRLRAESEEDIRVATLEEFVAASSPDTSDLPDVAGEMRSHARANILPGVISIRPQLKQSLARAERTVERYAEPLQAIWRRGDWPASLLNLAWLRLVDCSCHDSVTGCGVDETAIQVASRIAEAEHIGRGLVDLVTANLARAVPSDAFVAVNPSPRPRRFLVEVDLPAPAEGPVVLSGPAGLTPVQELRRLETVLADETVDAAEIPVLFRRVHDRELFGRFIRRMVIDTDAHAPVLRFDLGQDPGDESWDSKLAQEQAATASARHPGPWRMLTVDEPRRVVLAEIDVPALGFASGRLVPGTVDEGDGVSADEAGLHSADLDVRIAADGTLTISGDGVTVSGVGRISEGGDAGDSYNYAPPASDLTIDTPEHIETRVLEVGPRRARVLVRRRYSWPVSSTEHARSAETVAVDVDLIVELRRGEPFVRLEVSFDNRAGDHRVRLHLPCARPSDTSDALGQFAVTRRGRHPEAGPVGEFPLPTYPAYGFVDAGGTAVLLEGTTEYELVADPDELAITLVRGVAYLSRNRNALRDEPAGPNLPTPLGQSPGPRTVRLAMLPHRGDWADARLPQAAEQFTLPAVTRIGAARAAGPLPDPVAGLELSGNGVVLSSLVAALDGSGRAVDIRVVALTAVPTTAHLTWTGRRVTDVRRVDLLGREMPDSTPGQHVLVRASPAIDADGSVTLSLRPWEIATLRLTSDRPDAAPF
jgi:alpha-mannosidase